MAIPVFASRCLLGLVAFTVLAVVAARNGHAQAPAPQACEQSRLMTTAPTPACFYREERTQSGNCTIRTSSVRMRQADATSANYLFRLRDATPGVICYITDIAPQTEMDQIKQVDAVMANGHDWSAARMLNGATVATFTNQAGKSCVEFQQHGPRSGSGLAWVINGFYCEPPSLGHGPVPDGRIATYVGLARPRN